MDAGGRQEGGEGRFVADSCHSGGMERSASAFGVRFRKMDTPTIAGDQLRLKAGPTKTAMGR
jgi:hypothetical protein